MLIIRIILEVPKTDMMVILSYIFGSIIGISVRIVIITLFWMVIMPRYINNNELRIIQLFLGILLIQLAFLVFNVELFEMFIVCSIAIIVKREYKIGI
ncbi:hypothetical protein SH1V18_33680 [Vallitalea longa]|uniref:Uncharacterized protein n=2 Tax=Vallitalea longa TaxID=2936439 RepID=A0A9W6DGX5_9FIRM|nr:hypothetical protein SH1V18_33680 [Vallitalea longa]